MILNSNQSLPPATNCELSHFDLFFEILKLLGLLADKIILRGPYVFN